MIDQYFLSAIIKMRYEMLEQRQGRPYGWSVYRFETLVIDEVFAFDGDFETTG